MMKTDSELQTDVHNELCSACRCDSQGWRDHTQRSGRALR